MFVRDATFVCWLSTVMPKGLKEVVTRTKGCISKFMLVYNTLRSLNQFIEL